MRISQAKWVGELARVYCKKDPVQEDCLIEQRTMIESLDGMNCLNLRN